MMFTPDVKIGIAKYIIYKSLSVTTGPSATSVTFQVNCLSISLKVCRC